MIMSPTQYDLLFTKIKSIEDALKGDDFDNPGLVARIKRMEERQEKFEKFKMKIISIITAVMIVGVLVDWGLSIFSHVQPIITHGK